jgi:desulfoferrodoxin (superoxide reductase-like protein)
MEIYSRTKSFSVECFDTLSNKKNLSIQYGDSTITFTIISHPMELTSYITVINPVTNSLNGTVVECTDLEDRESPTSTVINVVNDQGNVMLLLIYKFTRQ